jgi:hypothetical protein
VLGEREIPLRVVDVVVDDDEEFEFEEPHAVSRVSDKSRRALISVRLTRTIHPSGSLIFKQSE